MGLTLSHPHLPSCSSCQKWIYDLKSGRRSYSAGQPVPRPPGSKLSCSICPKVDPSRRLLNPTPADANELSLKNLKALDYFYLTKSDPTGVMPRDELVVHNNSVIQQVIDAHDRARQDIAPLLLALLKR